MRLKTIVILIPMILVLSTLVGLLSNADHEITRAIHTPITVDGNSELASLISSEGWAGGGTFSNPYIIEDLKIDAEGYSSGISISNTNRYVTIRNCVIINANYRGVGNNIIIDTCNYVFIDDCTTSDPINDNIVLIDSGFFSVTDNIMLRADEGKGIKIQGSNTFTLRGNTIKGNIEDGIWIDDCNDFSIRDNDIQNNGMNGIFLDNSFDGNLTENLIKDNSEHGIDVMYGSYDFELSKNEFINNSIDLDYGVDNNLISRDNTVNGRPIYQYLDRDMTGMKAPSDAGMILGHNISGLEISGFDLDYAGNFVLIHQSDNITIFDINITNGGVCFEFNSVRDLSVRDCQISDSISGFFPAYCYPITVSNVSISNCTSGIYTYANWDAEFSNMSIKDVESGITLNNDYDPVVKFNTISNFKTNGIRGIHARRPRFENNSILGDDPTSENGTSFKGCNDGFITGNLMDSCNIGAYFENSTNMVVSDNIIQMSNEGGLILHYSEDMKVLGNMIFDSNGYGARLTETVNSEIFENTFISNSMSTSIYNPLHAQAYDDGTSNMWHKDSTGNHWSDWTTPDSDRDGFVDTPYSIRGGDNFDLYPLTDTTIEFLSEPIGLEAVPGNGNATLSWSDPEINMDDTIGGFSLYRKVHNQTLEVLISIPGDENEFTDTGLINGIQYDYRLTARNVYGEGKTSSIVIVIPDGTPPEIEITEPSRGFNFNSTNFTIEWTGSDDLGEVDFQWRLDESNWTSAGQDLSVELINITEGYHVFHLSGIDEVGNRVEINETLLVDISDPTAWFTNIDSWRIVNSDTIFVEIEWNDTFPILNVAIILDGNSIPLPNSQNTSITNLTDGEHVIGVWISDLAGNWDLTETTFTVDTISPEVIITRPSQGLTTINRTINATWTIVENGAGIDTTLIKLDDNEWFGEDSGSYQLIGLSPGAHIFTVVCTDLAGNVGEGLVSFEIFSSDVVQETSIISGSVQDEDGEPVSGVRVISDDGSEAETDSNGLFQLEVEKGLRTLTFEKDGYDDFTRNIDATEDVSMDDGDIILEEKDGKERSNVWRNLFICFCVVPLGIMLLLILVGLLRRSSKKKDRDHIEE